MLEIAGIFAVFAALFVVVGLPAAVLLRRDGEGWVACVADSGTHGLVLVSVSVTVWAWLGAWGAVVFAVGWLALIVLAVVRRRDHAWPTSARLSARGWVVVAVWVAVLATAVVLRLHSVNFVPWVGDMGGYVNWANEFARTGVLAASWPPLFPVYLSVSAFFFGTAYTTASVGLSGILLIVAVARLLQRLRVPTWVVLGAALVLALQQHAVWFSTFPGSESLNAPIFVVWVTLVHAAFTASGKQLPVVLGGQALFMLALCLLRGSGALLVVPLVAVTILALVVRAWRPVAAPLVLSVAASVLGAGVGVWYSVSEIPRYFVGMQIKGLLPDSIVDIIEPLGLLAPTPALLATMAAPTALLAWWGVRLWRSHRESGPQRSVEHPRSRAVSASVLTIAAALAVGVALDALVGAMVWAILLRLGIWFIVGAVVVVALPAFTRVPLIDQVFSSFLGATIIVFVALHTPRLGFDRGHEFYLYWDRYFVSEVLPAAVVLCALGLAALVPLLIRRWQRVVAGIAVVAIAVVPSVGPLALQSRDTYMAGAQQAMVDLGTLGGDPAIPRIWSGTSGEKLEDFFFVNTWMAFALPLRRTFGLDVVNSSQKRYNFGPDEVLNDESLFDYAACELGTTVVVYEVQNVGPPLDERLADTRIGLAYLGEITRAISTLSQPPVNNDWNRSPVTVKAWKASVPAGSEPVGECVR